MSGTLRQLAPIGLGLILTGCPFAMANDYAIASSDAGTDPSAEGGTGDANTPEASVDESTAGPSADEGPHCIPSTCSVLGAACGIRADGCGGALDCGPCPTPPTCASANPPDSCACKPRTCAELKAECGVVADGCGTMLDCGNCVAPKS